MESRNALETLSEDTVYCNFFPTTIISAVELEQLCEAINQTVLELTPGYIWHKDEFRVHVPLLEEKNDLPVHLISLTCFGDNIEDEWFIVYLLLEISKKHQNLVIQVYDNDGEFLLIEAADSLPSWANPDTTVNRVFIYQKHIHLIPPSMIDIDKDVTIAEAVQFIVEKQDHLKCPEIEQAVLRRISKYPEKITENTHVAIVKLPLNIATLLSLKPSLISPLVHAYCNHDVIDAKVCKNVKFDDCITVPVKFTKCLYAMLVHAKLMKTVKFARLSKCDKQTVLGLKLTCGYEIIMHKLTGDVFSSKEFNRFLNSLTVNGYFKGNIPGSQAYQMLLQNAKGFFLTMECPMNTQVCNYISQLMGSQEFADMKLKLKLQPNQDCLAETSDEWLNISPDQLNDFLNSQYGRPTKLKSGDVINSHTIKDELENFLKQTSDFEGIETDNVSGDQIEFDPELFMSSLKHMANYINDGNAEDSDFELDDDVEDLPDTEEALDMELKQKLNIGDIKSNNNEQVLSNIIQSMKEEGTSGPSSNLLRNIGINKTDILDSDDDDDINLT